jgi:hypothetical protein
MLGPARNGVRPRRAEHHVLVRRLQRDGDAVASPPPFLCDRRRLTRGLVACSTMTLPAVNPPSPTCNVCGKVATRFAQVVLQDKDDEREIGEVDLCDEHFDTWDLANGLSGRGPFRPKGPRGQIPNEAVSKGWSPLKLRGFEFPRSEVSPREVRAQVERAEPAR